MNIGIDRLLRKSFPGRTLVENAATLYLLHAVSCILPLILVPYLTRVLGPGGWGLVAFAQAFAQLTQLIVEYGFQLSATRELAQNRDSSTIRGQLLGEVTAAKLLLLLIALTVILVVYRWIPNLQSRPVLVWSAMIWMAGQAFSMAWYYQGVEDLRPALIAEISAGLISLSMILSFVNNPADAWKALACQGLALLLCSLLAWCWAARQVPLVIPRRSELLARLRSGRHLFSYRSALALYSVGNPFLLGLFAPVSAVGYFAGAEKIVRALIALIYPVAQALYPRVSYHAHVGDRKAHQLATLGLVIASMLGVLVGVIAYLGAPVLVRLLLGSGFVPAISILRVLALLCPLIAVNTVLGYQWLLPRLLDARLNQITLIAGILNVGFALLLVPEYGALGLAYSLVLVEGFVLAACCIVLISTFRKVAASG